MSGFKNVSNRPQFRKRQQKSSSSDSESGEDLSANLESIKTKKQKRGLHQSTAGKGRKLESKVSSSSSDEDDDEDPSSFVNQSYKSSRTGKSVGPTDMGATAELEVDTQEDRNAQAIIEKAQRAQQEAKGSKEDGSKKNVAFYHGQYLNESSLKTRQRYGPQAAPLNIRVTTRWDYAPDICKDYKETGTCGFGDSCKFLHDRSDFKYGWQLDAELDNGNFGEENRDYEIHSDEDHEHDELPETCWVCREKFKNPVQARCEHIFCEKCFLTEVAPKKKCPVCDRPVDGYAKDASRLKLQMQKKAAM